MLFNTVLFLVFFAAVVVLYWIIPAKTRWILLLLASLFFYSVSVPAYTIVLLVSVLLNYYFGLWIGRTEDLKKRKQVLVFGIILNILMLAGFKYGGIYLSSPLSSLITSKEGGIGGWIIPLGISFFTFTNLSYLIEVKRRTWEPERHLGHFALYVTFFPKLIQGPIVRPREFMPQVKEPREFDNDRAVSGLRLMLWGFFKKLVIADRLAVAVNPVYDHPQGHSGLSIVVATILYSFQIYADFSGYIDIARGAGKVLGFELPRNFNIPYAAKSIKDFWTRWHITLSAWLRDYIFLPLAYFISGKLKKDRYLGIRTDSWIYSVAITVTFLICGIWHGVGWNFLLWGALYSLYLVVGHLTEKRKKRFYKRTGILNLKWLYTSIQVVVTFTLVTFAWSLFRSGSMQQFFGMVRACSFDSLLQLFNPAAAVSSVVSPEFSLIDAGIVLAAILLMLLIESPLFLQRAWPNLLLRPFWMRWVFYYGLLVLIFLFGKFDNASFIYYQF